MRARSMWISIAFLGAMGLATGLYVAIHLGSGAAPASRAADELELVVSADEAQILVGQPLKLELRVINKSDRDLSGFFYLAFEAGTLQVLIAPPGQPFALYFPASLRLAETQEKVLRRVTIKAKKEMKAEEFVSYDVQTQDFAFPKAGDYRLKAILAYEPKDKKQLESGEIKVTVLEPEGKEKEALKFIVDNQLKPFLTPEAVLVPPPTGKADNDLVKQLQEFLRKFPESAYVPYVLLGTVTLCRGREEKLPACAGK